MNDTHKAALIAVEFASPDLESDLFALSAILATKSERRMEGLSPLYGIGHKSVHRIRPENGPVVCVFQASATHAPGWRAVFDTDAILNERSGAMPLTGIQPVGSAFIDPSGMPVCCYPSVADQTNSHELIHLSPDPARMAAWYDKHLPIRARFLPDSHSSWCPVLIPNGSVDDAVSAATDVASSVWAPDGELIRIELSGFPFCIRRP